MTDFSHSSVRPLARLFQGILSSQSFELVRELLDEKEWEGLLAEEKELLSQLFLLSADQSLGKIRAFDGADEYLISKERAYVLSCVRAACRLTPKSARVWFRLGSYLSLLADQTSLRDAIKALQTSISIDGRFFDAHYLLASTALRYGISAADTPSVELSDRAFAHAWLLLQRDKEPPPEFFWHWGIALFLLARESGEPLDYVKAIAAYAHALENGFSSDEFYNDYANCLVEVSLLLGRLDCIRHAAIPLYEEAALTALTNENNVMTAHVFNVACCYQHLFEEFHIKEDFERADNAFRTVLRYSSQERPQFWHKWGQLCLHAGRVYHDMRLLERAVECFETAETYFLGRQKNGDEKEQAMSSPLAYALWAEALLLLWESQGSPHLISQAYKNARRAFAYEKAHNANAIHPEVYAALGFSLYTLGRYFHDEKFYEKAYNLIQRALVDSPKNASLWYILGLSTHALGEMRECPTSMREALLAFLLASRSVYALFPAFWTDWGIALMSVAEISEDSAFAEDAVHKFERVLELSEEIDTGAVFNLACSYSLLGEMRRDEECLERALFLFHEITARGDTDAHVLYQHALAELRIAECSEEIDHFFRARELFEEYLARDIEDEVALSEYALCLIHLGLKSASEDAVPVEWFIAEECLVRAARSGFAPALYHVACLYSLMGNHYEAVERLYEALGEGSLPMPGHLIEDEWLSIRFKHTPQFHDFLSFYCSMIEDEASSDKN